MKRAEWPSFEEFKNEEQELATILGRELDTARIEFRYEKFIKSLMDDEYLETINPLDDHIRDYLKKLEGIFEVNTLKEGEVSIIIAPSFHQEWHLRLDQDGIWQEQVERQIWGQLNGWAPLDVAKTGTARKRPLVSTIFASD